MFTVRPDKLLLLVSVLVVIMLIHQVNAQTPSSSSPAFNITIGSTISISSPHQTSYWISPSTNFAFGFYPLSTSNGSDDEHDHLIGIWLATSCTKTVVWNLGRNDPPLYGPGSSISFDQDGVLMLQVEDNGLKSKTPLLGNMVASPASYATMQNDGNFVLYSSDSQIIWQSFDYPTSTLLPGQTLKSGYSLMSSDSNYIYQTGRYELIMHQDASLVIHDRADKGNNFNVHLEDTYNSSGPSGYVALNLESNGNLYLADWDDILIKILNVDHWQKDQDSIDHTLMYRATLDSDGKFRLYREMVCLENEKPVQIWHSNSLRYHDSPGINLYYLIGAGIFGTIIAIIAIFRDELKRQPQQTIS